MADGKNGTMSRRSSRVRVPSWQCHSSHPSAAWRRVSTSKLRCARVASHRAIPPREVTSRGHLERWKQATGISPAEGLRCGREPRPRSPTLRHPPPRLSNLGSIPGPLGLAICGYRNQVDHKVEKAAAGDHSGHDH